MPSAFRTLLDSAYADAIEPLYGVAFTHMPMRASANVNAPPDPDPSPPSCNVIGILDEIDADGALANIADTTMNRRPGLAARENILDVAMAAGVVRRGDVFVNVETGARYVVQTADYDDSGRYQCRVNAA